MQKSTKGESPWNPRLPAGFLLRKAGGGVVTRTKGSYSKGPRPLGVWVVSIL